MPVIDLSRIYAYVICGIILTRCSRAYRNFLDPKQERDRANGDDTPIVSTMTPLAGLEEQANPYLWLIQLRFPRTLRTCRDQPRTADDSIAPTASFRGITHRATVDAVGPRAALARSKGIPSKTPGGRLRRIDSQAEQQAKRQSRESTQARLAAPAQARCNQPLA